MKASEGLLVPLLESVVMRTPKPDLHILASGIEAVERQIELVEKLDRIADCMLPADRGPVQLCCRWASQSGLTSFVFERIST